MISGLSLILPLCIGINVGEMLPKEIGNWVKEQEIHSYTPENLFDYIDGEAERYLPYEFKLLTVVNYKNSKNVEENIEVQLYEMSNILNAFGIFSTYRDPAKESFQCGNAGIVGGNQAMFYQAMYFVKMLGNSNSITSKQLLEVGKKISEVLPKETLQVQELKCLELDSKLPNTERYLAKDILSQSFFLRGFVVQVKVEGKVGSAFIVVYENGDKARKGWNEYIGYLDELGADYSLTESNLRVLSPGSEICIASLISSRIVGIWVPGGDLSKMKEQLDMIVSCLKNIKDSSHLTESHN